MSEEQKQLDFKLTDKCAVCKHDLDNPVFCKECGNAHCAACWFLTGKCATYNCDNSETYRPSVQEQIDSEQHKKNIHIFETMQAMQSRIDCLERNLEDAKSFRNHLIIGSFIIIFIITLMILLIPKQNPDRPIKKTTVSTKTINTGIFKVGQEYEITGGCSLHHRPIIFKNKEDNLRNKKAYLIQGDRIHIIDYQPVDEKMSWYKAKTLGKDTQIEGWLLYIK